MKVYLSHSVGPADQDILFALAQMAPAFGVELRVGLRPWTPPHAMPPAVYETLKTSDAVLVLLLQGGDSLACTNMEVGFVRNICQQVPVALFMDENAHGTGCLQDRDGIRFHPNNHIATIDKIFHYLKKDVKLEGEALATMTGFVLAVFSLLMGRALRRAEQPVAG
jgi:hypothetical protein